MIQPKDVVKLKGYSLLFQEIHFSLKPHFCGALTEALTYGPKAGDMPPKLSFRLSELQKVLSTLGCLNKAPFLKDWCLSLLKRHPPHRLLLLHRGLQPGFTLKQFSSDMSCSALRWYAASRRVREDWEARRPPVAPLLFSDR